MSPSCGDGRSSGPNSTRAASRSSTDAPETIRAKRAKHGLQATMLGDPDGAVIEALGIRNHGVHSGPPGARLPIPTTVLVDAGGVVRWIDQAETYQRRSDPAVVRAALDAHLPGAGS